MSSNPRQGRINILYYVYAYTKVYFYLYIYKRKGLDGGPSFMYSIFFIYFSCYFLFFIFYHPYFSISYFFCLIFLNSSVFCLAWDESRSMRDTGITLRQWRKLFVQSFIFQKREYLGASWLVCRYFMWLSFHLSYVECHWSHFHCSASAWENNWICLSFEFLTRYE